MKYYEPEPKKMPDGSAILLGLIIFLAVILFLTMFVMAAIGAVGDAYKAGENTDALINAEEQYCKSLGAERYSKVVITSSSYEREISYCKDSQGNEYKIKTNNQYFCHLTVKDYWGWCNDTPN